MLKVVRYLPFFEAAALDEASARDELGPAVTSLLCGGGVLAGYRQAVAPVGTTKKS